MRKSYYVMEKQTNVPQESKKENCDTISQEEISQHKKRVIVLIDGILDIISKKRDEVITIEQKENSLSSHVEEFKLGKIDFCTFISRCQGLGLVSHVHWDPISTSTCEGIDYMYLVENGITLPENIFPRV